jgi:hypothetical protein
VWLYGKARGVSVLAVDGSGPKFDFVALLHHRIDELLVRSGRVAKKRTPENSVKAKFVEFFKSELPRMPIPRPRVNKGKKRKGMGRD